MGGGQSGLPLWGSFAGEGAAGGGRLGRGRVARSLGAPPWLKPCADACLGSGGGCQGARGDPAPGQTGRRRPTLLNIHGQGGGQGGKQPSYAIAGRAVLYNLSLQRKHLI